MSCISFIVSIQKFEFRHRYAYVFQVSQQINRDIFFIFAAYILKMVNTHKSLLLLVFMLITVAQIYAQSTDCTITFDGSPAIGNDTLCYETSVRVATVDNDANHLYSWDLNGVSISSEQSFNYTFNEEGVLTISISDLNDNLLTTCSTNVFVREPMIITFEQLQLTCNDEENGGSAKVRATVSGSGSQYTYKWTRASGSTINQSYITNTDSTSTVMGLYAYSRYKLMVTNEFGCKATAEFYPQGFHFPEVEIISDPDTAYIQNPTVLFSYNNLSEDSLDIEIINHSWDFGDDETSIIEEPSHVYERSAVFSVTLRITTSDGCDTTYTREMVVCPVNLFIPNVITPNGDGYNDYFMIKDNPTTDNNSESKSEPTDYLELGRYYERTELVIFNRWGRTVYQSNNYQNDWDGGNLPDGTYFYVLKCHGHTEDKTYQGSVTIFRGYRN